MLRFKSSRDVFASAMSEESSKWAIRASHKAIPLQFSSISGAFVLVEPSIFINILSVTHVDNSV